jgi:hypothetical protein
VTALVAVSNSTRDEYIMAFQGLQKDFCMGH